MKIFLNLLFCVVMTISQVNGHGRLLVPPARSTAWREGFNVPANYNDNELNCGGFSNQWDNYGGKCGLCGDPYQGPRKNEAGGVYATGTIVRTYAAGSMIDVTVQITANHKGYHQFRICNHNDPTRAITQECLDQHLLRDAFGNTEHTMGEENQDYTYTLQLPAGLTCTQCVLQWKYNAGNSWGVGDAGEGAIGLGAQEQFFGCADIAISGGDSGSNPSTTRSPPSTTPGSNGASTPSHQRTTVVTGQASTSRGSLSTTFRPNSETTLRPSTTRPLTCVPTRTYQAVPGMDDWCRTNCALGNCPRSHCICPNEMEPPCVATDAQRYVPGMDNWCRTNCAVGNCPSSHCVCLGQFFPIA